MRAYLHLFFGLLIPLSALFVIVSIGYLTIEHDFTKTIRLGVIYGILASLAVSFVVSIFLQVRRLIQNGTLSPKKAKMKASIKQDTKKIKNEKMKKTKKDNLPIDKEEDPSEIAEEETKKSKSQKVMLLMDQELAYEVTLNAIKYHSIGNVKTSDAGKNTIHVKNKKEALEITFTSPTKHTAQVKIETKSHTKSMQKIITYLKEKEHSFLQY